VYPGVYPGPSILLIQLGKITATDTDEQNFHVGTYEYNLMIKSQREVPRTDDPTHRSREPSHQISIYLT